MSLFSFYGHRFLRYRMMFKIAIFRHETWRFAKIPKVAHILYFYPIGSKLTLFSLYEQRFLRYGPSFKTWPYLGIKLGHWPSLHIYSFLLRGAGRLNLRLFSLCGQWFQDTGRFSKLPYLGMKLCHWPKFQKLHIYFLSTPGGRN